MSLAGASPGWDSTCNQRTSFPWGTIPRWIFAGHSWVWCGIWKSTFCSCCKGSHRWERRQKPQSSSTGGSSTLATVCPRNQFKFQSEPILLLLLLGQPVYYTHTEVGCAQALTHFFFHCSRLQAFQQVAFSFLRSIPRNSAGPQHCLCLHRLVLLWNGFSLGQLCWKLGTVSILTCLGRTTIPGWARKPLIPHQRESLIPHQREPLIPHQVTLTPLWWDAS